MSDPRNPFPGPPPGSAVPPWPFQGMTSEIYANQLRLGATISDFAVVFGLQGPAGGVRDRMIVHLAPTTLKQLALNVQMAVEAYEEAVGPISMPAGVKDQVAQFKRDLITGLREQMGGAPGQRP
jgi:hypothetical protein